MESMLSCTPSLLGTPSLVAFVLVMFVSSPAGAVESPLETINIELKQIKSQMNSVQQSLITSVGLLQDQVSELSSQVSSKLDTKLGAMDTKLGGLDGKMSQLQDRAHVWDTLQHHVTAWNSLMKSVDDKIIHISRSQDDKFLQQSVRLDKLPDVEFKLETVSKKVDDIGGQLQIVDTRLMSLQDQAKGPPPSPVTPDVTLTLQNIEAQLKNISTSRDRSRVRGSRQRASNNNNNDHAASSSHNGGHNSCHENRQILHDIQSKVDVVYDKSVSEDYNNDQSSNVGPRFDYLRSQPPASEIGVSYDIDDDFDESENNFVRMFRKLATPFKKANKRLKAMEDIQGRFDNVIKELQTSLKTSIHDMETKFNEFYTMSYEMFEQQNSEMERYSANFAGLLQCCKGHSGDFDRFKASASPILSKLDTWMVTWSSTANQKFELVLEQHRYNTNRIVTGNKELERILTEGFDRCNTEKVVVARRRHSTTTEGPTQAPITSTQASVLQEEANNDHVEVNSEGSGQQKPGFFKGCEDLRKSGEGESKVFTVGQTREINEQHRDYNRRFCDQETSGGGWTVIQRRGDYGEPRINFTRPWADYKHGFGDLYGEFWFGNDYISKLSTQQSMMLRIELQAHNGTTAIAEYTTFRVDGESVDYRLWVGGYSGNATDSLSNHNGYKFSTVDRNNDEAPQCCPCAPAYGGGWWFYSCFEANLNGEYFSDPLDNGYYRGIIWELWLGDYSLKAAKMMIRPRDWSGVIPVPPDP